MALFMDKRFLTEIIPIIRDKRTWDAFLAVLVYEENKVITKLKGPQVAEELIRINAQYTLLQNLKKLRDNALNAEREFNAPE